MKILSQNKEVVYNCNSIVRLYCNFDAQNNKYYLMAEFSGNDRRSLACYDSKDKCKQMISDFASFDGICFEL